MAARYRLHGACEVAGLAEEGFPNSRWAATVEAINANHTVKVKYRDVSDGPTCGAVALWCDAALCIVHDA